jgi:hypothetical protein
MSTEITRTPAGAQLEIRRSSNRIDILIDRWHISNTSPTQKAAVEQLAREYGNRCLTHKHGRGKGISSSASQTIWHVNAPAGDEGEVVERLLEIEASETSVSPP